MILSRRNFIKVCLTTAGVMAFGGWIFRNFRLGSSAVDNSSIKSGATSVPQRGDVYRPRYLELAKSGELERRERELWKKMERCSLCPRMCGTNRMAGRKGICSADNTFKVASHGPHFGEERPLVGQNGSGTIFFSNCNLLCVSCLNWQINHLGEGRQVTSAQLADMMLTLQRRGCHNINLVTPSHIVPHAVTALRLAIDKGLNIPLLYNCSGYESLEVIQLLDGIVDIYLPDFKYQDSKLAARFSQGAPDYVRHTSAAIKEMHRQVGTLSQVNGVAHRGLLIRHLVLPENLAATDVFARWVVSELGADTHVNIMSQYRPIFRAQEYPPLDRRLISGEFEQAMRWAREAGLRNFH